MFTRELGDGVALRPCEERDADELHRLIDAHRELLSPWMPWAAGQTAQDTREFIARSRRAWIDGEAVETVIVDGGAIVGAAGLNRIDAANRSANVGYWLSAGAQHRGLVTRAVAALLDHAFDDLDLHRVELRAAPANERSRAVAQRLGFTREGVARNAEWIGPHFVDHVVHSMLAGEWAARREREESHDDGDS